MNYHVNVFSFNLTFTDNWSPYCAMALCIDCFCLLAESYETINQCIGQNRHKKVFNSGALLLCGELDILKIDKNATDL